MLLEVRWCRLGRHAIRAAGRRRRQARCCEEVWQKRCRLETGRGRGRPDNLAVVSSRVEGERRGLATLLSGRKEREPQTVLCCETMGWSLEPGAWSPRNRATDLRLGLRLAAGGLTLGFGMWRRGLRTEQAPSSQNGMCLCKCSGVRRPTREEGLVHMVWQAWQ